MFTTVSKTTGWVISFAIAIAIAIAIAAPVRGHTQEMDRFTLGWPTQLSVSMAHISFGEELGFFEEENVDLEIVSSSAGSLPLLQQIKSGGLDAGYLAVEALILAEQNQGIIFDQKLAFNYMRRSIWEIIALEDSPINEITDLGGKTIGVGSPAFGNIPITRAILTSLGVDQSSVNFLGVGLGTSAFRALRNGDIDVLNLFDTMHATLESTGVAIKRIPMPAEFTDHSSQGFMFSDETLENRTDLVERFGRAMAKSIVACNANAEGCVKAFWKQQPGLKPKSEDDAENLRRQKFVVETRQSRLTWFPEGTDEKFGAFRDEDWDMIVAEMKGGGSIPADANVDTSKYFTNAHVEAFNDFNADEVIQRATNWK